jgi:hypothetical protein
MLPSDDYRACEAISEGKYSSKVFEFCADKGGLIDSRAGACGAFLSMPDCAENYWMKIPCRLPNSLTFEVEVRGQVAFFSPRTLPNVLTYGFLRAPLKAYCTDLGTSAAWRTVSWKSSLIDGFLRHACEPLRQIKTSPSIESRS